MKFKADNHVYFLHHVIAFVYGNRSGMPWSRFRGTRGYEGDHNAGPHNCLRKTVQVVTRRENLRRDRERRARKEGVYSLAYLAVKTKAAIAKGKAKAKAKAD